MDVSSKQLKDQYELQDLKTGSSPPKNEPVKIRSKFRMIGVMAGLNVSLELVRRSKML